MEFGAIPPPSTQPDWKRGFIAAALAGEVLAMAGLPVLARFNDPGITANYSGPAEVLWTLAGYGMMCLYVLPAAVISAGLWGTVLAIGWTRTALARHPVCWAIWGAVCAFPVSRLVDDGLFAAFITPWFDEWLILSGGLSALVAWRASGAGRVR